MTHINPCLSSTEKMQALHHLPRLPKGLHLVKITTDCPKHGVITREVVSIIAEQARQICPHCKAEQDEQEHQARIDKQRSARAKQSGIIHYLPFDTWQASDERMERIALFAQSYAQNPQGNLILSGATGTGKTMLANLIATVLIQADKDVLVIRSSQIGEQVRASWSKHSTISEHGLMEGWIHQDLLVIDELGEADLSYNAEMRQADRERLSRIIDGRYSKGLPTVITTNLTKDALTERIGDRAWDRLQQHAVFIAFNWQSYRQTHAKFVEI